MTGRAEERTGNSKFETGNWKLEAVTKFESQDRLARALQALGQADFPAAITLLEELVVEDAANAHAWSQLGVCYLETQRPSDAVEALSRAVQAAPMDAQTQYLLGNACGSLGQLDRAAACYRRALELDPHHAKAEEFLMKVESLIESRGHYRAGLSLLYSQNPSPEDFNRALRELIISIAIFENSPARDNLHECAHRLLELQQERPLPLEIPPEHQPWAAACERGWQCIRFKNWVGAQAAYEEALTYRAGDAFVHQALGFIFCELGALDNAVRAWLRALELDSHCDFTHLARIQRPGAI
jgi:tetratricopeptide (TPR) repeat protein